MEVVGNNFKNDALNASLASPAAAAMSQFPPFCSVHNPSSSLEVPPLASHERGRILKSWYFLKLLNIAYEFRTVDNGCFLDMLEKEASGFSSLQLHMIFFIMNFLCQHVEASVIRDSLGMIDSELDSRFNFRYVELTPHWGSVRTFIKELYEEKVNIETREQHKIDYKGPCDICVGNCAGSAFEEDGW